MAAPVASPPAILFFGQFSKNKRLENGGLVYDAWFNYAIFLKFMKIISMLILNRGLEIRSVL